LENAEDDIRREAAPALEILEEEKEHEALYTESGKLDPIGNYSISEKMRTLSTQVKEYLWRM